MSDLHFDVVGAEDARRYFGGLTRAQLGHAYLFTGPSGVGKKTFARRLAQSLLCEAEKPGLLGYDETCSSCRLFAAENSRHPDFVEHLGTMKIGSRDVAAGFHESEELSARDLVRQFSLQSYGGGLRVLLLGDIAFAGAPAANALLKFLEEPPAGVVLLLTTAAPGSLLPTIRSRLVEVRFAPLSNAQLQTVLTARGFDAEGAARGAALAGGSARRALDVLASDEDSLRTQVAQWFFEAVRGRTPAEPWATRDVLLEGLEIVKALVRDWVALGVGEENLVAAAPDKLDRLRDLPQLSGAAIEELLAGLAGAQRMASTNVPPTMVGEIARMALTRAAATSAA